MTGNTSGVAILIASIVLLGTAGTSAASSKQGPAQAGGADWPKLLPKPEPKQASVLTRWSAADIVKAKAKCAALLKGLDFKAIPLPPLRRNNCGNAAPMKLISIGSHPRVVLSPAPTVNCEMIAGMHQWLARDLQPMAKRHLGAPIVKIDIMSSYSCRNAYGRRNAKLSQHARANALDIRGFITGKGDDTALMDDWGPTVRKFRRPNQAIAAGKTKKKSTDRRHVQVVKSTADKAGMKHETRQAERTASPAAATAAEKPTTPIIALRGSYDSPAPAFSLNAGMSRLGGPKPAAAPADVATDWRKSVFLRAVHQGACKIFGTVLGPEANHAHRHHFHVDMAKRKLGPYCR